MGLTASTTRTKRTAPATSSTQMARASKKPKITASPLAATLPPLFHKVRIASLVSCLHLPAGRIGGLEDNVAMASPAIVVTAGPGQTGAPGRTTTLPPMTVSLETPMGLVCSTTEDLQTG